MDERFIEPRKKAIFYLLSVLILLPLLFLAADSIFTTASVSPAEITAYSPDLPWVHLAAAAVITLLLSVFKRQIESFNTKYLIFIVMAFTFAAGLYFLWAARPQPGADQGFVWFGASEFLEGNYIKFGYGEYFFLYPHQLGMVAYAQLFIQLFGPYALPALQGVNLLWLMAGYCCLCRIAMLVFEKKGVANITLILTMLGFQLLLYTGFVYGNISAFGMGLIAVFLQILYFKRRKLRYAFVSVILIVISILLRNNNLIWLCAMALFYLIDAFLAKKLWPVFFIVLMIAGNFLAGVAVNAYYARATGNPENEGVPKIAWVAMGLQESEKAPGWYNEYSRAAYEQNGFDAEETKREAWESIGQSLERFGEDPAYAARFFYEKASSAWSNPTYQCFWITITQAHRIDESSLLGRIFFGDLNGPALGFMNIYQTVVYLGAALFFILRFKKIKWVQLLPGTIFLGTFLFHLFWETKGQYTLTAFALLIPYAAYGWLELSDRLRSWYLSRKKEEASAGEADAS